MVWRDIRDDGDVRAALHRVQLEGAELQHSEIVRLYLRYLAQQRVADVAAEMDGVTRVLQKLGYNGGCGGLAVAAGYGDRAAWAQREEHLHLRGNNASARLGIFKMLVKRHETGRAEYNIMVKPVKVLFPQLELCAHVDKLQTLHAHIGEGALVADSHVAAAAQQKPDERGVAHAHADNGDAFSFQALYVIIQCQGIAS